jgi:uncharacterized protein (DUF983 family)
MTKVRTLLFTALAVVLACGICGQQALAQEDRAGDAYGSVIAIGHVTDASPDVTSPGMYQGITAMGPNPPVSGDWPCFGGSTCSNVVAGGLVIGTPEQVWTKSCSGCGQIYYTFQTTTATGTATFTITVTQGSPVKTLFHYSFTGSVAKNSIEVISVGNVSFAGAVAGAATINVATTIGTATIKGAAKIVLH